MPVALRSAEHQALGTRSAAMWLFSLGAWDAYCLPILADSVVLADSVAPNTSPEVARNTRPLAPMSPAIAQRTLARWEPTSWEPWR